MKKISVILSVICLILIAAWQILAPHRSYYLISVCILLLSMIPFLVSFERSRPSARELTLTASLIALAVISRAVFYLIPQVKPIGAVVVVCGVCLGAQRGYLIGAFSAFISNFIFGQGIWTPFQMAAMGLVGLISGLVFSKLRPNRISLSILGFILTFALYGVVVDASTVLMMSSEFNIKSVLAIYATGVPFSFVFGVSTAVFLFLFGMPFIKKIDRINTKYGIYEV